MLSVSELSTSSLVILLAGFVAVCALLVSKVTELLSKTSSSGNCSSYECGFDGSSNSEFVYVHEHNSAASLFVVAELAMLWLLICCTFCVTYSAHFGNFSTKILALILVVLLRVMAKVSLKFSGEQD